MVQATPRQPRALSPQRTRRRDRCKSAEIANLQMEKKEPAQSPFERKLAFTLPAPMHCHRFHPYSEVLRAAGVSAERDASARYGSVRRDGEQR